MKKRIPKVFAVALSAAMLASLSATTAFAANTVITNGQWNYTTFVAGNPDADPPTADDNGTAALTANTITVTKIEDESDTLTVTAYQLVKGSYLNGRLTGYTLCDPTNASIADLAAPTEAEVTAIAAKIKDSTTTLQGIRMTRSANPTSTFTANVEAGLYIVLVENAISTVYNPAIVSVNVSDADLTAGSTTGGSVDMTSFFTVDGNTAYAKSTTTNTPDKTIVGGNKDDGDFARYGETVNFKIDNMTIPSYSSEFTREVTYKLSDTLDPTSFGGVNNLVVKLGNTVLEPTYTDPETQDVTTRYTVTYKGGEEGTTVTNDPAEANYFEISFNSNYVKSLKTLNDQARAVEVTYSSVLLDTANVNFSENKNTATLNYSHTPTSTTTSDDTTYHYTFAISSNIDAQDPYHGTIYYPAPIYKTSDNQDRYDTTEGTISHPLANAQFTLYTEYIDKDNYTIATWAKTNTENGGVALSDANGEVEFKGLKPGTYYLKETNAPEGYAASEQEYKIDITATLNPDGTLNNYEIKTFIKGEDGYSETPDGKVKFTSVASVQDTGEVVNKITQDQDNNPLLIVNTTLAELPATGGIGTIIITVTAALGMGLFLTLFIVSRKKKSSSEK